MRYEGRLYRPPSEANAFILQATIGCSWNNCLYCDMYQDKKFRIRDLSESLEDLTVASTVGGDSITKVFVADGDALAMPLSHWEPILAAAKSGFPNLKRVSCYAMARNLLEKSAEDLQTLREAGLTRLYIGPESGDPLTLRRIAKGGTFDDHVEAARRAREAGMEISVIALLGAGGRERSPEHAQQTAKLITAMDPDFFAALTLTVIPGTPMARMAARHKFELPDKTSLLQELRTMVAESSPSDALFRTNHASNYLPLGGRLPADRDRIVATIDAALQGQIPLRPDWSRGL